MTPLEMVLALFMAFFGLGLAVGVYLTNSRWRERGDHEYMNRMESRGRLYHVRRDD